MPAPTLHLCFKKLHDGATALSLTRADGTVTWQRTPAAHAAFFAKHDLTHYAVETVLAYSRGFLGLIAEGWDFTDFGAPWPRGPIPADADPAELIVGFLDAERAGDGSDWSPNDFTRFTARFLGQPGPSPDAPTIISGAQLDAIHARMRDLFDRWDALPPGETLELAFPADDAPDSGKPANPG